MYLEHIDTSINDDLDKLLNYENKPCISIYIPTLKKVDVNKEDKIRYKNALQEAEELLEKNGIESLGESWKKARQLLDDHEFWTHQSNGLAVFMSEGVFHVYRLPLEFNEKVVLSNHFYLKPLFPFINQQSEYYLLALSLNDAHLYQCNEYQIKEVQSVDLPDGISEALAMEESEKELQFHTGAPPSQTVGGGRQAVFHGQGETSDYDYNRIWRYLRLVNDQASEVLKEKKAPLVLASDKSLYGIYKDANTYPNLYEAMVAGNPDEKNLRDLKQESWEVVKLYFMKDIESAKERFQNAEHTETVSTDVEEIVAASVFSRVDTLFVDRESDKWGWFDSDNNKVSLEEDQTLKNGDLLNYAAMHTYKNGGRVFTLARDEMPSKSEMAAAFRFPA